MLWRVVFVIFYYFMAHVTATYNFTYDCRREVDSEKIRSCAVKSMQSGLVWPIYWTYWAGEVASR